jgi:uncharacterized protein involved in tolerance to divalent cations
VYKSDQPCPSGHVGERSVSANRCVECVRLKNGHKAGYEWAESKGITDEADCEAILVTTPNRTSFYEGCLVYVEDPSRGADEDDDGDEIED